MTTDLPDVADRRIKIAVVDVLAEKFPDLPLALRVVLFRAEPHAPLAEHEGRWQRAHPGRT